MSGVWSGPWGGGRDLTGDGSHSDRVKEKVDGDGDRCVDGGRRGVVTV